MKTIRIIFLILLLISSAVVFTYAQDKKEEARDYYRVGNLYYQQGRYKEAQEMFEKAIDLVKEPEAALPAVTKIEPAKEKDVRVAVTEPSVAASPAKAVQGSAEYLIGADDILLISVWQNPDLNQEAIVRPDGKISFPLIGDVQASGLTITELDNEITKSLKEFIKYPEVSISIRKIGGSRVVVLGQVSDPGIYSVAGKKTIMEAVGMAGGFTRDAVPSSTVLIRGGLGTPHPQRINLSSVIKGDLRQNVVLESQDIIFVPRKFISDLNYFLSQILDPIAKGVYTKNELQSW